MEACQSNNGDLRLYEMILKSDDLMEIIDWLNSRITEYDWQKIFYTIGVSGFPGLAKCWGNPEIREALKLEVRKRATVADCKFKLEVSSRTSIVKKNKFIPKTFIDMTSMED